MSWRRKLGPLGLYLALIGASYCLLPALGRDSIGPLFKWNLFATLNHGPAFDIRLRQENRGFLLTDPGTVYESRRHSKFLLWKLAQEVPESASEDLIARIKTVLNDDGVEFAGLCRIHPPLAEYMLLPPAKKEGECERIL
jgi:hypothetical protein